MNIAIFALGPTVAEPGTPTPAQSCVEQRYFVEHGAIPGELVSGRQPAPGRQAGVRVNTTRGRVLCTFPALPPKNPFVSVLAAMFVHAGCLHLAGNMFQLPSVQGLLGVPADGTVACLAHVAGFLAGFAYLLLLTAGRRLSVRPPGRPRGRTCRSARRWPGRSCPAPAAAIRQPGTPTAAAIPFRAATRNLRRIDTVAA